MVIAAMDEDKKYPRPIGASVLVRQDPPKNQIGSFFVPQGSESWPPTGTVVRVGAGYYEHGQLRPMDVQVGDRVLFKRQPDSSLVVDEREGDPNGWKDLVMLDYENILGIVEEE